MVGPILAAALLAYVPLPQAAAAAQQPPAPPAATAEQEKLPEGVLRLAPGIVAPKIIAETKPGYTAEAMRARIQGDVKMDVVVKTDGTVGEVRVTRSLDKEFGLDDQAVKAVKAWRFTPGQKDGVAVPVMVSVEMTFRLKR